MGEIDDPSKPPDEQTSAYESLKLMADHSRTTGPPRVIMVYLESQNLQGFIRQNVIAAALIKRFPDAYAMGIFRNDPPERGEVVDWNPYIIGNMQADAAASMTIPVDWFDLGWMAPVKCPDESWYDRGFSEPDLFFLPSMLNVNAALLEGLAEAPPTFQLPNGGEPVLEARGLRKDKWFACFNVSGVDAAHYLPLIDTIVKNQGGQLVCLGFPEDCSLPNAEDLFDFRDVGFSEKAAALRHARYVIGTDDWPLTLASAFRTPVAATNVLDYGASVWNDGDTVLAKKIYQSDGRILNTLEALEAGYLEGGLPAGVQCSEVEAKDLIAVANATFDRTGDCPHWRSKPEELPSEPARKLTYPLSMRERPLLEFWT